MDFWKKHKNDLLLVLALLVLAGGIWGVLRLTRRSGGVVRVTADGETVGVYPLSEDRVERFETEYGSNTLTISGGSAGMTEADCPDGLCIRQGRIRHTGESIVCLPHRLIAVVEDGTDSGLDVIAR